MRLLAIKRLAMARVEIAVSMAAVVVLATGAFHQERPDFSGAWTASSSGGGRGGGRGGSPAGTMGSGWGPEITIKQDAETLTVERVFFSRGDMQPAIKYRYSLNGFETTNRVLMGRGFQELVSTAAWEGETLVIRTVQTVRAGDGESGVAALRGAVEQRLTLRRSASLVRPPSLLIETTISGALGGPPTTTRTLYTPR